MTGYKLLTGLWAPLLALGLGYHLWPLTLSGAVLTAAWFWWLPWCGGAELRAIRPRPRKLSDLKDGDLL
jgi:hypothetical protein